MIAEQNCRVVEVLFDGDSARGVELEDGRVIEASFVMDASGQRAMIGRHFGMIQTADDLKSIAHYGYFSGADGIDGPLSGACSIHHGCSRRLDLVYFLSLRT